MIKAENLTKEYKSIQVLNVEGLEFHKGESIGLVGNNGAGKTTFFNCLLDLIKPTTGYVSSKQEKVNLTESWKAYTGSYIDESFLIGYLTPDEYFKFVGDLRGMNIEDIREHLAQFKELFNDEIIGVKKYLRDLSKGNQKKAGIAAALMGNPEVVVLDEPFANLDPTTQFRLKELLRDLSVDKGVTLLVSSHDLNHVTEVCDRIVLLEKGQVIKDEQKSEETLNELENYFKAQLTS
ncbi:MAG: ABC transporter ATP-binding protein [Flavobacteriaceae bacterium]